MKINDDGHLWVAMWGGPSVFRISPDGVTVASVDVPARQPTSVCLVGGRPVVASATTGLEASGSADRRLYAVDLADIVITATAPAAQEFRGG